MPVDEALLERRSSFIDESLGIAERSLRLDLGGGWTLGVLSRPLGPPRATGWVMAHSFGPEQMELQLTEVLLARRLAAAGFPVLRFHGQGYGDSERLDLDPTFSTHLRDTEEAVDAMRAESGLAEIGIIGARFGGTVAAVAADRLGLGHLVLVSPAVSGRRFLTEMLRAARITSVAGDGSAERVADASTSAPTERALNVNGFLLTPEMRAEIEGLDLLTRLRRFAGRALVVQVSMKETVLPPLARLVDRLNELGADAVLRVVTDPAAPRFGREHMRGQGGAVEDMLVDLNRSVAQDVVAWASDAPVGPGQGVA